jgi:hypothetical protein
MSGMVQRNRGGTSTCNGTRSWLSFIVTSVAFRQWADQRTLKTLNIRAEEIAS